MDQKEKPVAMNADNCLLEDSALDAASGGMAILFAVENFCAPCPSRKLTVSQMFDMLKMGRTCAGCKQKTEISYYFDY